VACNGKLLTAYWATDVNKSPGRKGERKEHRTVNFQPPTSNGVRKEEGRKRCRETVKTVAAALGTTYTPLKRGVNETRQVGNIPNAFVAETVLDRVSTASLEGISQTAGPRSPSVPQAGKRTARRVVRAIPGVYEMSPMST
jgi:hypothetical protein